MALPDRHDYYKMDASPKGFCLIINNFVFTSLPKLDTGPADKKNLICTFEELDFEVRYCENQKKEEMITQMQNIQEHLKKENYGCFVCCISSHGDKTGVCGTDGDTVTISELQEYVYSTKCPSLAGKPKVFFVDACRGGDEIKAFFQEGGGTPSVGRWITSKQDFLLSFATTSDNVSYLDADPTKGAVYFQHLTKLLKLHGSSKMVTQILHKLSAALTDDPSKLQTSEYVCTLTKDLYFLDPVQRTAFCFNDIHGKNVRLRNYKRTAYRRGSSDLGGVVMSRDPMQVNKLYKVQTMKQDGGQSGIRVVGVVTSNPDSLLLSEGAEGLHGVAVLVCREGFTDHNPVAYPRTGWNDLPVDSILGVSIDVSRNLYFYKNGEPAKVPCRPLPDPCWAMWDICTKVKTLPVDDIKWPVSETQDN